MADLPQFDRKMSDAEGLMWRLEKDPHLSSTFAAVTILDRPPDFDRLLRANGTGSSRGQRLGQRVQPVPANLTAPTWVDDTQLRPAIPRAPHRPARSRARCASCSTWPA